MVKDPHTPIIIIDGIVTLKPEIVWDAQDMKMIGLNAKPMNVLYCALDANKFNKIFTCIFAKKI